MLAATIRRISCVGLLTAALTFAGAGASLAATGATAGGAAASGVATTSVTFTGFGNGADERAALADAERDARQQAADEGFTECKVVFTGVGIPIIPGGAWSAVVIIDCAA